MRFFRGLIWAGRGAALGLALLVPGLSGGTVALVMGFYRWLLSAISEINLQILLPLAFGMVGGVILGGRIMESLLEAYPGLVGSFLTGLILATGLGMGLKTRGVGALSFLLLGLFSGWAVAGLRPVLGSGEEAAYLALFLGGILSSMALVLPGVSGAAMLVVVGQYQRILLAVNNLDLSVLLIFSLGAVLGLVGVGRLVREALRRRGAETVAFLVGLMLGSIRVLWPSSWGLAESALLVLGLAGGLLLKGVKTDF